MEPLVTLAGERGEDALGPRERVLVGGHLRPDVLPGGVEIGRRELAALPGERGAPLRLVREVHVGEVGRVAHTLRPYRDRLAVGRLQRGGVTGKGEQQAAERDGCGGEGDGPLGALPARQPGAARSAQRIGCGPPTWV